MLAVGVDVSKARGLDLVFLDSGRRLLELPRRREDPETLSRMLETLRPGVVAIDSPSSWAVEGNSRLAERELMRRGIHIFFTPSLHDQWFPFYDWMRVGHKVFAAANAAGYQLYRNGLSVKGCTIEVFPHATAVALKRSLPPSGSRKRPWRVAILEANGVQTVNLHSQDEIDAALAALTGLLALKGEFAAVGDPVEGVIVVPGRSLPERFPRPSHM